MKILNLFAGIGGNRKRWGDEHNITAVEIDVKTAEIYKNHFCFDTVIVADALQFLLNYVDEFDFIWASPPCTTHTRLRHAILTRAYPDLTLYEIIIFLKKYAKGKWCVENVQPYYAPLITPTLRVSRHLFWTNFFIDATKFPSEPTFEENKNSCARMADEYGVDITELNGINKRKALRNCVSPVIAKEILDQAINPIELFSEQKAS